VIFRRSSLWLREEFQNFFPAFISRVNRKYDRENDRNSNQTGRQICKKFESITDISGCHCQQRDNGRLNVNDFEKSGYHFHCYSLTFLYILISAFSETCPFLITVEEATKPRISQ